MATKQTEKTAEKTSGKKPGNYSEPGIHEGDEVDASGHKGKFDRGDPSEDKTDIKQEKVKGSESLLENPVEYAEAGIHSGNQLDASGHKKKADRAAPEENPEAFEKMYAAPKISEETEVSEPSYVAKEEDRLKEANKQNISGLSEKEFLQIMIEKAASGGWSSPIVDEMKHRVEGLS